MGNAVDKHPQRGLKDALSFNADREPSFLEWLLDHYEETPQHLHDVALATGPYRDYNNLMSWYRDRYRQEMQLRKQLISHNPFDDQEETK